MSRNLFAKPTTPALPERPDDVPEEEWDALGDPGKTALVRVRQERDEARSAQQKAERERDAARARPTPPRPTPDPKGNGSGGDGNGQGGDGGHQQPPDFAAMIKEAVDAAVKPFQEREQKREAAEAAEAVVKVVRDAAEGRYIDTSDALGIDLSAVVGEDGKADPAKVKQALDDHLAAKPHLAKGPRVAPPLVGGSPTQGQRQSFTEQVQSQLAEMQAVAGVRPNKTT